jgi:hypothetical protein
MTRQRDLKDRIRARMAKTGEAYMTARRHVLADREDSVEPPFDFIEPVDVTDQAAALGLRCRALMFPRLAERIGAEVALGRLRDALTATDDDPATALMRAVVLRGELPPPLRQEVKSFEALAAFIRRVRAGIGGASPGGGMLALLAGDALMLCVVSKTPRDEPVVFLQLGDEVIGQRNLSLLPR